MNCIINCIIKCFCKEEKKGEKEINVQSTDFINKKENNYQECVICLEEMKYDQKLSIIMCSHIFHKECLDKWKIKKRLWPLCDYEF